MSVRSVGSVLLGTALYGAWTHVALDGFMHADVPVWGNHTWANTAVLNELLLAMVLAGAGIAMVTHGLPRIARYLARYIRRRLGRQRQGATDA